MSRVRMSVIALAVLALIAALAGTAYVSAASLGDGTLDSESLEVQNTAVTPNVTINAPFTNTSSSATNVAASAITIEGQGMAATTTGAPSWSATNGTSGWQVDPGDWAKCGAAGYSAARVPWMNRSSIVQVNLKSVVASPTSANTSAGIFMRGNSAGTTAVGARLVRNPNGGTTSDRWRFEIVTLSSSTATVVQSVNLYSNSTSNPTAPLTMKLDFTSSTSKLVATLTDGGSGSWSLTQNTVPGANLAGNYAGMWSFQASATQFDNFQARMN